MRLNNKVERPLHVTQVIMAFYPCQIWGGPPRNTAVLSRGLLERGHSVRVLTTNILDHKRRIGRGTSDGAWDGIDVTYLNAYWYGRNERSLGFIVAPDVARRRRLIGDSDVIHIHGYRHFLFMATALLANWRGVPYVVQARGTMTTAFGRRRLKALYDRLIGSRLLRRAGAVIALSETEAREYAQLGVDRDKIHIVYNAFDATSWPAATAESLRQRYAIPADAPLILFLARLQQRKGLDILIRAMAEVAPSAYLLVAGPDHGARASAEALAAELGLAERIIFAGPLYGADKTAAYETADLFVIPSLGGEGLPTTVIEACHSGLPIVITDTIDVSRQIDGVAGVAVAAEPAAIAAGLNTLLRDPARRDAYAAGARGLVRRYFDRDTMVAKIAAIYASLLEG